MNLKKVVTILILIIIVLTQVMGCKKAEHTLDSNFVLAEENKLVIFTSHKEEIYEPIIKEFEEQTGIWVEVVYGGTTDLLNTIKEADDEFVCDVMFGGSAESLEDCEAYFLSYKCTEYDQLYSQVTPKDYKWTLFTDLPLVIIYNNKTVYPAATPRGWEELLFYIWEGKLALADPLMSGSSYTALATLLQLSDMEDEEVIDNLVTQLGGAGALSSGAAVDEVSSGIKQVGITLEATAMQRIEAGENISIIYPLEGTAIIPDGTAILKNAKHIENAQKFIDFTVSRETQEMVADRFYRRSVRDDVDANNQIPSDILAMNFDVVWASENKNRILELWKKYVQ